MSSITEEFEIDGAYRKLVVIRSVIVAKLRDAVGWGGKRGRRQGGGERDE